MMHVRDLAVQQPGVVQWDLEFNAHESVND